MRVCSICNIDCTFSNIPPVSVSTSEATAFFSDFQTVRMGPFSFGLGVLVVGGRSAVYRVALKQCRGSSLVVTHCTADVPLTSDRPFTLGLVLVELSISISGSHAATYVVNAYVS